ncbi:MAG: mandelate racemase [Ahrensia sp.]|nr:mandelate racemase [Ahrensia sp.]
MKIASIKAIPLYIPIRVDIAGAGKDTAMSICLVRVDTDCGRTGWGFTAITEEEVIAEIVDRVVAPNLVGEEVMARELIWHKLYWLLSPRGQTGYASHAIAAIDVAIWDLIGQKLEVPVWKLLGGSRNKVPLYATFGFPFFDQDQLAEAARHWVADGFTHLKMTVGDGALKKAASGFSIDEAIERDIERVKAVREAVGSKVRLYLDANCNLDLFHAAKLARAVEDCDIAMFEEPITQNDVPSMVELKRKTSIPLSCGQNEGLSFRFRDLLAAGAVDVVQPNVVISGGYTQCLKIAGMAEAHNVRFANGGAWSYHNMHIHAGLANGGLVEHHYLAVECYKAVYRRLPEPEAGFLPLPEGPGLGFTPDEDAVRELSKRPTSAGAGKA